MRGRPYLVAYADDLSATPGDRVVVRAAADRPVDARVDVVELRPFEPGADDTQRVVQAVGAARVGPQRERIGSCVIVPAQRWDSGAFTASVLVMPTRPRRRQAIMSQRGGRAGWCLGLDDAGCAHVTVTDGDSEASARANVPLIAGAWYALTASVGAKRINLDVAPLSPTSSWRTAMSAAVRASTAEGPAAGVGLIDDSALLIAAIGDGSYWDDVFDGKIEAPVLNNSAGEVLAAWDFSAGVATSTVHDTSPRAAHGRCVNGPLRAVTGHNWDASCHDFTKAPDQYAAIHFHADDLTDCGWPETLEFELDPQLASGIYGVRFDAGEGRVDHVPLFVVPRRPSAAIALLVPTASYLAYANDHPASDGQMAEAVAGRVPVILDADLLLHEHREWGLSCYDAHADGSGVAISSARRPLLNMRPDHRYHVGSWQLPADLELVAWLGEQQLAVDVLTDEQLHADGAALLGPYRVVLTGTHPEYCSTEILDAIDRWIDDGGRLVYLGANGFYWRIAFDPEQRGVIEVRRGQAGSRAWESSPGECHLARTGGLGGLWRHLGRPPQRLFGVGYAAQGFDASGWFRRCPDSHDPRASFVFDGVEGERIGTRGSIGGGAAGQELDRYDRALGTPHDALLLATSEGLSEGYLRCVEELAFNVPGSSALVDPQARADVVYFVRPSGGAVFATGSIAWAGALRSDPDVSRITRNVIERFADPAALPW